MNPGSLLGIILNAFGSSNDPFLRAAGLENGEGRKLGEIKSVAAILGICISLGHPETHQRARETVAGSVCFFQGWKGMSGSIVFGKAEYNMRCILKIVTTVTLVVVYYVHFVKRKMF